MVKKVLLKTKGEDKNKVGFVLTEDKEPVFQGVFDANFIYSEAICSVRVKERLSSRKAVFCEAGRERTAFVRDCDFMPGKMLLVQAESAEHENKGIRFTTDIRLRGKYVVVILHQYSSKTGINARISRKVTDIDVKNRLHDYISSYPERYGVDIGFFCDVICRTSIAELEDLSVVDDDLTDIFDRWSAIYGLYQSEYLNSGKVGVVKGFGDVLEYILQHEKTTSFDEIITDSPVLSHELSERHPELSINIKCMPDSNSFDIFAVHAVDNKLAQLIRRTVHLKSGAYLVVEFTEAMTVIDVNSGKNTTDSAFDINIEAAREILRQLRLRDIGGIIVCDFINMPDRRCEMNLVEYMKEFSEYDPCELFISEVSRLGIVEIARKRN